MKRVVKIKTLKEYRFFSNFSWNEANCKLFAKYNIIYGWNGSGKTTICDFFRDLEQGELSEEDAKFSVLLEDTASRETSEVNHNRIGNMPCSFRVFYQNYIKQALLAVLAPLAFDYTLFEKMQSVIATHNKKSEDYQRSIEVAQKSIEHHIMAEHKEELDKANSDIAKKRKELSTQSEILKQISKKIESVQQEVRNSQMPATAINDDIKSIMGRAEIWPVAF